ncbi:hypothetical protein PIB30_034856 [Stylosanthes scabra]|uniref:RNase H type-1 domain-containing protein n=1 Tax=Stylosanthes scabra TaxID=79078 RepID=A0ABU6ZCP2_9FABA|nr:hypothetical protein [Stylosanthes scabra]
MEEPVEDQSTPKNHQLLLKISQQIPTNIEQPGDNDGRRGVGVVIRNEDRVVIAAATMEVQENLSVKEAEAMGRIWA